ncbi:MAG: RluA family pseudouridine synthase [Candidatus Omnitrophota bacterium]|nr:RluA family pseudouridine synthase [Candidatus Omnitrophota bacterium]
MQEYNFTVSDADSVLRLDMYIIGQLSSSGVSFSRASIQKLMREGNILLDGKIAKPHHKIKAKEEVKIIIPPPSDARPKPEDIPLEVIYEDEDLIVINKPRGLVVHPAAGNPDKTLVNALLFHCKELSAINPDRPGIVHRLDKDTAGLLVAAKNNKAHLSLIKQFAEHSIKRIYMAIVLGNVQFDEGIVDLPIGRHALNRVKMAVDFKEDARPAYTRYKTIKRYQNFTFIELTPQTGRTHQLRVHMAALGHPILGDEVYGRKDKRIKLALYAKYIGFIHPRTEEFVEFEHVLPIDMQQVLDSAS